MQNSLAFALASVQAAANTFSDSTTIEVGTAASAAGRDSGHVTFGLFWVSLALVNGVLAQIKGRSGFAWSINSLLLGPVATFSIGFLDAVPPKGKA